MGQITTNSKMQILLKEFLGKPRDNRGIKKARQPEEIKASGSYATVNIKHSPDPSHIT